MLCERCNSNDATMHMSEIIGGFDREIHLCERCSREVGLNRGRSPFSLSIPELLDFLKIREFTAEKEIHLCPCCGMKFSDFQRIGKFGCSECYTSFTTAKSFLDRVMLGVPYEGKVPRNYRSLGRGMGEILSEEFLPEEPSREYMGDSLESRLEKAIDEERYEEAALLRDRICEIKKREGSRG